MGRLSRLAARICAAFALTALLGLPAHAQEDDQPAPCSAPEYRQMDFWLGTWDVSWVGQNPGEVGEGTNTITQVLDGCAIMEEISGEDSLPLRGLSLSNYHAQKKEWRQLWLDNEAGYLPFTGGPVGKTFILTLNRPEDAVPYRRMVWENIREDSLDWRWQESKDDGQTWSDLWHIRYVRRK